MTVAINEARKELQALAKQMRALMALDQELELVGGLDHLIAQRETQSRDLERQIRDLSVVHGQLVAENEAMRVSMDNDKKQHVTILGEAKRDAEMVKARARDDALIVIQDANKRADRIIQDAEAVKKNVQAKVSELETRQKQLHVEIAEAEKRREEINAEVARLRNLLLAN